MEFILYKPGAGSIEAPEFLSVVEYLKESYGENVIGEWNYTEREVKGEVSFKNYADGTVVTFKIRKEKSLEEWISDNSYALGDKVWFKGSEEFHTEFVKIVEKSGELYKGVREYKVEVLATGKVIENVLPGQLRKGETH
ncbi:hypothetical protein J2T17_000154 [Paenibacillus mucilaginosus]